MSGNERLTPETLRGGKNLAMGWAEMADWLDAHVSAWQADIRDWHVDCLRLGDELEADRKRLVAAERVIANYNAVLGDMGIYPKSFTDKYGRGYERTEWMEGWNAALVQITDQLAKRANKVTALAHSPEEAK